MNRSKAWLVAVAFSAVAASAYAGDKMGKDGSAGAAKGEPVTSGVSTTSFKDADTDRNGAVDSTEAGAISGLDFSSADADSDGKLSRSEFESAMGGSSSSGDAPKGEATPDRQPTGGPNPK